MKADHNDSDCSSSRFSLIPPSNVPIRLQSLANVRELKFRGGHRLRDEAIPDAHEAWMEFAQIFQGPTAHRASYLEDIMEVMRKEYKLESEFDIALFLAMRKNLEKQKLIFPMPRHRRRKGMKNEDFPIVFKYGVEDDATIWPKYAIGIRRESNGELTYEDDKGNCSTSRCGLALRRAKMNHSTCLLARLSSTTPWKAVACLSTVGLEISSAHNFATLSISNDIAREFALTDNPGGATQVMMYTMEWVLPSLGNIGQIDDNNDGIPWSVIIGKQKLDKSNTASQVRTRAISGKIYVPEACADRFEWNVTGYVRSEGNDTEDVAVSRAISMYLGSLFFGLSAAKTWMDAPKPVAPRQTSGQKVMFGKQELTNLRLRGSAAFGTFPSFPLMQQDTGWRISQGEIFTGKVNLYQIKESLPAIRTSNFAVFQAAEDKDVDVVVKVSSRAVHGYLVDQSYSFHALDNILSNKEDVDLSDVLYAVYHMPVGMVTIMADLSIEGYHDLKPNESNASLVTLWKGFQELVQDVLLPLANIGYIHPDIRPGFDSTANILCRMEESGSAATMRLIDYESIVLFDMWLPPSSSDHKYIKLESTWSSETFVWWQCFSIAYSWIERKTQMEMISISPMDALLLCQADTQGTWLEAFRGAATTKEGMNLANDEMDPSDVIKCLDFLEVAICNAEVHHVEMVRQEDQTHRCEEDVRRQGQQVIIENERHYSSHQEADRVNRLEAYQTQEEARQTAHAPVLTGRSGGKNRKRGRRRRS